MSARKRSGRSMRGRREWRRPGRSTREHRGYTGVAGETARGGEVGMSAENLVTDTMYLLSCLWPGAGGQAASRGDPWGVPRWAWCCVWWQMESYKYGQLLWSDGSWESLVTESRYHFIRWHLQVFRGELRPSACQALEISWMTLSCLWPWR